MSWRMSGELWGRRTQEWLAWDDGLTGTDAAVAFLDFYEEAGEIGVTPVGPFIKCERTSEQAAFLMGLRMFRHPLITGDTPTLPTGDVPEGVIS